MTITKKNDYFRLEVMLDEQEVRLHSATIVEEGGEEIVRKQHPPKVVPMDAVKPQVQALLRATENYAEEKPESVGKKKSK